MALEAVVVDPGDTRLGTVGNHPAWAVASPDAPNLDIDMIGSSGSWNVSPPDPIVVAGVGRVRGLEPDATACVEDRIDNDAAPSAGSRNVRRLSLPGSPRLSRRGLVTALAPSIHSPSFLRRWDLLALREHLVESFEQHRAAGRSAPPNERRP